MSRTITRNLLACACLSGGLLLAFAGPGILGRPATSALAAASHHSPGQPRPSGSIQRIGVRGSDRLTAAARTETAVPDVIPADLAQTPAQPAAQLRTNLPTAAQPTARPAPPAPPFVVGGAAGQEFSLINQDRAGSGVRALAWSAALSRVAQYRAQDMLTRNYFSHYDPSTGGLAFVALMNAWGIGYTTAGENIAWSTDPSMGGINTMFMNSPEHRANILNPAFGRLGVGVASNGTKVMVVEVFSN